MLRDIKARDPACDFTATPIYLLEAQLASISSDGPVSSVYH